MTTADEPTKVIAHLAEHWDEDMGDVLWWNFPVEEPPYCGTPLDDDFPSYKTHFTQITMPDEVEEEPKYEVVFREDADDRFLLMQLNEHIYEIAPESENDGYRSQWFTEQEIKSIDERYWKFAVAVEKVEE